MPLFLTFLLGLFIVLGALIPRLLKHEHAFEQLSIAVAFGTMAMMAIFELPEEAMESLNGNLAAVIIPAVLGVAFMKGLDRFIPDHDDVIGFDHECSEENVSHIGVISTIAVVIHNVVEGMAVFSFSRQALATGMVMAFGIGLHNIPMGMVIDSTLQHESRKKRWILLGAASISTFVGGILAACLWTVITDFVIGILISIALGMMVYIIVFELAPHLMHEKNRLLSVAGIAIGIAIMLLSRLFE